MHRYDDPSSSTSYLLFSSPSGTSFFNTWHKLIRYRHHYNFLDTCISKNVIPKGLQLRFNVELVKDDLATLLACKSHCQKAALLNLIEIKRAVYEYIKDIQNNLEQRRTSLFSQHSEVEAKAIYNFTKKKMKALRKELYRKER